MSKEKQQRTFFVVYLVYKSSILMISYVVLLCQMENPGIVTCQMDTIPSFFFCLCVFVTSYKKCHDMLLSSYRRTEDISYSI